MTQDTRKKAVAEAALDFIEPDMVLGVGSGSTVNYFIQALANSNRQPIKSTRHPRARFKYG